MTIREQISTGYIPNLDKMEAHKKIKRKYPIFVHPKKLELILQKNNIQKELIIPNSMDSLTYFERDDIYSGVKVATFQNEKGDIYFIHQGNRILAKSSSIYTLQTNLQIKRRDDMFINKNCTHYDNGEFPTGTFCAEVTGFNSSKKLTQISKKCIFFNEGDMFYYYSDNFNSEIQNIEKKVVMRQPIRSYR
jgi:hypothetical protein